MTNTDTVDVDRHGDPGQGTGHRRLRDGAHHRQHARGRAGRAAHPRAARPHGHRRAAGRRLPLQRPPPADRLSRPAPRRFSKYRINPGNVGKGDKGDRQFAQMVEVAARYDKPVRIGVNWGSLDQELLAQLMDENARLPEPHEPQQIMYRAIIMSAIAVGPARRGNRPARRTRSSCRARCRGVQDLVSVYRALGQALRLRAAPGPDRSRHGHQGHGGLDGGRSGAAAAGGHRRHHPRLAHAAARRGAHPGGGGGAGDPAVARPACVQSERDRLSRAAAAPPAPRSRSWPSRSTTSCVRRCRCGRRGTPVSRP